VDKLRRLSQVVDRIREKYGDEAIRRASSLTSLIEALPHQITGMYGEMLPRQPLRFLLADEAILITDTDVLTHLARSCL